LQKTGYLTDLLGSRTVDVVGGYAKSRQPFFISLHFNAPHWPWEAVGDQAEAERLRTASLFHHNGGSQKTYQQMIEQMDLWPDHIGSQKVSGKADNPIQTPTGSGPR
jgi:hypothetical protein